MDCPATALLFARPRRRSASSGYFNLAARDFILERSQSGCPVSLCRIAAPCWLRRLADRGFGDTVTLVSLEPMRELALREL